MTQTLSLTGLPVKKVGDTLFVALPRTLWRQAGDTPCNCPTCVQRGAKVAYWDTLALAATKPDYTWTVHYPELHAK